MRPLTDKGIRKRGCYYCADKERMYDDKKRSYVNLCPYDKCPYHELDDVKTYGEYIQKTDESGLARALAELTKE
jgi:hypothetical protein